MDTNATLIKIAAVSVTAVSLAGIGVLTGVLPTPGQNHAPAPVSAPAETAAAPQAPVAAPAAAPTPPVAAAAPAPSAKAPASPPRRVTSTSKATSHKDEGSSADRVPERSAAAPAVCRNCGVIDSIQEVKKAGEGTGLGAVAGGVLGGILGNQVGGGRGRDAMAVVGAAGGAYAGHQVEKNVRSSMEYRITVRFDDGTTQAFTQTTPPSWRNGDRVRVRDGVINAD